MATVLRFVYELFAVDKLTPTSVIPVAISPARDARLHVIISMIKGKRLSDRGAILPIPPKSKARPTPKDKTAPDSAGATLKMIGRLKQQSVEKKKLFLNNNVILTDAWLRVCVFGGDHKDMNYS